VERQAPGVVSVEVVENRWVRAFGGEREGCPPGRRTLRSPVWLGDRQFVNSGAIPAVRGVGATGTTNDSDERLYQCAEGARSK
jgi:hypothetical protein